MLWWWSAIRSDGLKNYIRSHRFALFFSFNSSYKHSNKHRTHNSNRNLPNITLYTIHNKQYTIYNTQHTICLHSSQVRTSHPREQLYTATNSFPPVLVTGATGKQGGAVLKSLLAANTPTPQFSIIALTRSLTSAKAQSLASLPNVTTLQGDLNDCAAIFAQLTTPLWGVFSVQTPEKPAVEEQQGKDLVDAAVKANVSFFVYSSVDRGGDGVSENEPTIIPHFISKHNIEKHLIKEAGKMQWTIIRPVAFMENFIPGMVGKGTSAMWKLNGDESKLQLVSTVDIGRLAALAFRKPEEFKGRSIGLAGDDLTWNQMNGIFEKVTGSGVPNMHWLFGKLLRWMMWEQLGIMFVWFGTDGYGIDIDGCRRILPELLDLETWLKTESEFKDLAK